MPGQRWIALLRAINVGGHTVRMDRLRALFEELGFQGVETLIASGNVLFDAEATDATALEARIEERLKEALGYEVATFVRTPGEIAEVAALHPFPALADGEEPALMVAVLKARPDEDAVRRLMEHRTAADDFHVRGREVYWLCRTRISESAFSGALLERTLRAPSTLRNVTTVRKLAARRPA